MANHGGAIVNIIADTWKGIPGLAYVHLLMIMNLLSLNVSINTVIQEQLELVFRILCIVWH